MASTRFLLAVTFVSSAFVSARVMRMSRDASLAVPGFLTLPVHAAPAPAVSFDLQTAQDVGQVSGQFNGLKYTVNVAIGNNYQPVVLQVDTGSSETWVNPDCSTVVNWDAGIMDSRAREFKQCENAPEYDPNKSASAKNLTVQFCAEYDTGNVTGTYFTDDVRIGEKILRKHKFGVAKKSHGLATGMLGLGPSGLQQTSNEPATGFIDNLKAQGLIKRTAFSLSLRTIGKNGGLVFGGIDTRKYKGQLAKFAMKSQLHKIPMIAVGQTFPNASSTVYKRSTWNQGITPSVDVILNSGSPFTILPRQLALSIGAGFPKAMFDEAKSRFIVPCDSPSGTIDFSFGQRGPVKTIHIPYADFIYKSEEEKDLKGDPLCVLGMMFGTDESIVLGNSFLRAAYVVYDSDGKEIWIGEADDCGENIVAISEDTGVPVVDGCK